MRYFFVLSMGRSGTQMLSAILDCAEGASVRHEPCQDDVKLVGMRRARIFDRVLDGQLRGRFEDLEVAKDCRVYGEVNSYLRYEADWLRNNLDASLVFVCRDGRDFVRSAYERVVYTPADHQMMVVPEDADPMSADWDRLDRFDKLCWYWAHTNEMLLASVGEPVQMERTLSDYDYFARHILRPIDLHVEERVWRSMVERPMNTGSQNRRRRLLRAIVRRSQGISAGPRIPHWRAWGKDLEDRFRSIAGPTMERLGYPLDPTR